MTKDYTAMWRGLGLDLKAHDALLKTLGGFYGTIYLGQKGRPRGMDYFDFAISEIHGQRIEGLLKAKEEGKKVFGVFCVFVPEELILAAGGVCVGLCAGAEAGFDLAEQHLPKNTCALIKSFFGFRLAKLCPFTAACDLVIGETTCDGKKKAYEIFNGLQPTYVMEVPQTKSEAAKALFRAEMERVKSKIEEVSGKKITAEGLNEAIKVINSRRRALTRLNNLRKADPAPISGLDALLINQIAFYDEPVRFTEAVETLCDELEERVKNGEGAASGKARRILISGCPMAVPNWKVPFVVEGTGAVIVGEESCVGVRHTRNLVAEDLSDLNEMLDAVTERYFKIDCATFTPNNERQAHIVEMTKEFKAQGVIHYAIQFCQPYTIEARRVEERLDNEGINYLRLETDYSMEDMEALKTRVEAFLEVLD
ncbi:MAG: double-cubane-cluster-containing anaerobic reductase [Dissulfurimicrobium sp.]